MATIDPRSESRPAGPPPAGGPGKYCDLVMKGGVTSGIVYPRTVSALKDTYTFKNIGGTSAGAMAAAATAAAEYGRQHGHPEGFDTLGQLDQWLSVQEDGSPHTRLFDLFQPSRSTRSLYQILIAAIGPTPGKWLRIGLVAVRSFWVAACVGALPGLVLMILALAELGGWLRIGVAVLAALFVALGVAVAISIAFAMRVAREMPGRGFGLCTGCTPPRPGRPLALTNWLTGYLNGLAGMPEDGAPLTFGDLWGTREPSSDSDHAIRLEMMTTNLTHGRPYRLPTLEGGFYFDPEELKDYFPENVVRWMVGHPRTDERSPDPDRDAPLRPLPGPADLPVVVGARLSLALPILISAVPLYAIDYSKMPFLDPEERKRVRPERCWFSDGGICSNFPVHFFDAYLPRWPTFAIDLESFNPDDTEHRNDCWMPKTNQGGTTVAWNRFDGEGGLNSVFGFIMAIIDAARNWSDSTILPLPGYRDRIVHVCLDEATEGGMNLDMPPAIILGLGQRGAKAGGLLLRHFDDPPPDEKLTWDNHRWVRFRSMMALFEDMLDEIDVAMKHPEPGDRSYSELLARGPTDPPTSYPLRRPAQQQFAEEQLVRFRQLIDEWLAPATKDDQFREGDVPRPRPSLRITPNL